MKVSYFRCNDGRVLPEYHAENAADARWLAEQVRLGRFGTSDQSREILAELTREQEREARKAKP